jgi:hypothetical protein
MQNVHPRRYFWDSVLDRLDMFSTFMMVEEGRTTETTVAAGVPRLSREEHDASVADCAYLRLPAAAVPRTAVVYGWRGAGGRLTSIHGCDKARPSGRPPSFKPIDLVLNWR